MIDHISLAITNFNEKKIEYTQVFQACGYTLLVDESDHLGFGRDDRAVLWIFEADQRGASRNVHVALEVNSKEEVKNFHEAALQLGWQDNGAPGFRPEYSDKYYGAFAIDPQGNNLEAVTFVKQEGILG